MIKFFYMWHICVFASVIMENEEFLKKYTEHLNENQLKAVRLTGKSEDSIFRLITDEKESASRVLGYKLGGKPGNYVTGSPSIEPIVHGLSNHEINYIVIEDGEIVDQADFE